MLNTERLAKAEDQLEKAEFYLERTRDADDLFNDWSGGRISRDQCIDIANARINLALGHLGVSDLRTK